MKIFSLKRKYTTELYLYIVKGVNEEDAFFKLSEFTNMAKNKEDWDIKELDMEVNCIN